LNSFRHQPPGDLEEAEDLIYVKLPSDISNRYVMLMDAVLSTGNTACKAIKVCQPGVLALRSGSAAAVLLAGMKVTGLSGDGADYL
jgi:uracil phosphoribosyltransferase